MLVCILYTAVKNWRSSTTHMTTHAHTTWNNDLHRTISNPHNQGLFSIIYHRPPPSFSLISYLLYLILYDRHLCYTSRREILLSFEFSGYRALKNLSKFVGNILQTPDPPPWFCVQPVSRHFGMFFLIGHREWNFLAEKKSTGRGKDPTFQGF